MPKILIIEDELVLQKALIEGLSGFGWEVFKAGDGEEGFFAAVKIKPDLILLDLLMPKVDGMAFLKKLRGSDWGKNIPVLVLTNFTKAESINDSMNLHVDGYLIKSDWKLKDLVDKIKSILDQKQAVDKQNPGEN